MKLIQASWTAPPFLEIVDPNQNATPRSKQSLRATLPDDRGFCLFKIAHGHPTDKVSPSPGMQVGICLDLRHVL